MMDPISKFVMDHLIGATADLIMPAMLLTFILGVVCRWLIYFTAKSEYNFCSEFEKRVRRHYADPHSHRHDSFFAMSKLLLEKTFHEVFELRAKYRRRNLDTIATLSDRIFLIQDGMAYLVRDTLRQIRYLKREGYPPKLIEVSKSSFDINPVFNRLMGILPANTLNDLINILPGLFIIGGIFGTFLGIAKGLPDLGGMDLGNIEESKRVMDLFLVKISQAMVKSIIGIALSVLMSLMNTIFSAEGLYFNFINKFTGTLEILWNETTTNFVETTTESAAPVQSGKLRINDSAAA